MKKSISLILTLFMLMSCCSVAFTAFAWNPAPAEMVDMSLDLVGMMNVKIFQENAYVANVNTVADGQKLSGVDLYGYKFSTTGNSIGKNWPMQEGDGPYSDEQLESKFGVSSVQGCMDINQEEAAVYMLYDFGNPNSEKVKSNMRKLGIDNIDEYYALMAENAKITIAAYPGGGTAHETAITAYYRFCDDWRDLAKNCGGHLSRKTMLDYGIAAPNENRYFFETQESAMFIDGVRCAFPGVFDESVQQYIDHKESYSLPVWEDENEDATWNIINPVPTCNIYSRWGTDFSADTDYATYKAMKDEIVAEKYGDDYTSGEWYGKTESEEQVAGCDGLDIDDIIVPKNWEWTSLPYYSGKTVSTKNGVTTTTYSSTTASKSHLGYGEYCPAGVTTYHEFNLPHNQADDTLGSRFMTVMVRETGTMCGLDGNGHWHSVKVSGVSTTNVIKFDPEINDDFVVIDYGLDVDIPVDKNDWVWTTDATSDDALPAIQKVEISNDGENFSAGPVNGKYGTLTLKGWSNTWADGSCVVRYTPKQFVDKPDVFYYKVYPATSDDRYNFDVPMIGKVTVVPASVMYYEDNFSANDNGDTDTDFSPSVIYTGNWSCVDSSGTKIIGENTVNGLQTNENEHYGFDVYYENNLGYSDGTAHKAEKGDTLTFTFRGTGCDVIMRTDAQDGYVAYSVEKSPIGEDGEITSSKTAVTDLTTISCRNDNGTTLYQLPVLNLRYDEYAYYTVTLKAATTKNVYVDGIRVYNPLGVYGKTDADNETMDETYAEKEKNITFQPVHTETYSGDAENAMVGYVGIIDNWNEWWGTYKNIDLEEGDFDSHATIGPNNEIYLGKGQAIVFTVNNADQKDIMFAIEAKTLTGPSTMNVMIFGDKEYNKVALINTNTAMYYEYDLASSSIGTKGTIVIENAGDGVLSLSNFKYSSILSSSGVVDYTFVDKQGNPVSGVNVYITDKSGNEVLTATTDSTGKVYKDDLSVGKYVAHIVTPGGLSNIPTRSFEFSVSSPGDIQRFTLLPFDLTIGSHESVYISPTVSFPDSSTAKFINYRTFTSPGSYKVSYTFDGSTSGYLGDRTNINGTLSVIINSDGTGSYTFNGSGKTNNQSFASSSGVLPSGCVSFADNEMSIDYISVLQAVTGQSGNDFKFTSATGIMPNETDFTVTAYELAGAQGEAGNNESVTIGEEPHFTVDDKGTAIFGFTDENDNPVSGVEVTINGVTYVSDSNGIATCTNVSLGTSTATFTTPRGLSNVKNEIFSFDPWHLEYSKYYTLIPFDLDIGSHESVYLSATVDRGTQNATFINYRTFTAPGSMSVSYTFDGSTSGYVDRDNYLNGTLTVVRNSDGTAAYSFNGSGKVAGNNLASKSGTVPAECITYADNQMTVDYVTLLKTVTNKFDNNFKFTDLTKIMPENTQFTMQAYEEADLSGEHGAAAQIEIGKAPVPTVDDTGTATYTFTHENGTPVQGVKVYVNGTLAATSGADGKAVCTGIPVGVSSVTFETPSGLSKVAGKTLDFSPSVLTDTDSYTLYDFDLTLGSHETVFRTPSVSLSTTTAQFRDYRTYTSAGSYTVVYNFDGTNGGSGYVNKDTYISGSLAVTVNADGTATYDFTGSGKTNTKGFNSKSGTVPTGCVSYSANSMSIDYTALLKTVTGQSGDNFRFTDITDIMPNNSSFAVTAYERANAAGDHGNTESFEIGATPTVTSDQKATLSYTFTDTAGNGVSGVQVKLNGNLIGTSNASGEVNVTDIELGDYTVSFECPEGYARPANTAVSFNPVSYTETKSFTLQPLNLTIGSGTSSTPAVTKNSGNTGFTVSGFSTESTAGSYALTFDISMTIDNKNKIDSGSYITLLVSSDEKVLCDFYGSGKSRDKQFLSKQIDATSYVTYSDDSISVDLDGLVNTIPGNGNFNNTASYISNGSYMYIQAFEDVGGAGESGAVYQLTVEGQNAEPQQTVLEQFIQRIRDAIARIRVFFANLFSF